VAEIKSIEVTDEMIQAGLEIIWNSDINRDFTFDPPKDVVRRVFLAMHAHSMQPTNQLNHSGADRTDAPKP
jgi:ribosomal protein L4